MKSYSIIVVALIGMYAVFTGRVKAVLCAVTLGKDSALKCDQLLTPPLPMQMANKTYYPDNYGND